VYRVSNKVALGTMMFGWKISLIEANKIINYCMKNKINFFDTSPSYGGGLSEIICGKALKSYNRKKYVLSTKFSLIEKLRIDNVIRKSINKSLQRLQTSYIDYFVLHHDVSLKKLNAIIKTIKFLKNKKIIRFFILSNPSNKTLDKILKKTALSKYIDGFQFKRNLLFYNNHYFKTLKFKNFKLISYSPLAEGVLTGKYLKKSHSGRIFEVTKKKNYYKSLLSKKNKLIVSRLYLKCGGNFFNLIKKSYQFFLSDHRITNVLIGVSSFNQLNKNISILNKIR